MKPKAPIPPKPKMSEEERKEQMTRAFLQKRASLAEGILFNLCQGGFINLYTMETLKERAIQNLIYEQDFCGRNLSDNMVCRAYVKGATDQKAIDIDKACEWLKENARDYACATIRCPYGEEEEIICDVHQEIVEDFRKAMEE